MLADLNSIYENKWHEIYSPGPYCVFLIDIFFYFLPPYFEYTAAHLTNSDKLSTNTLYLGL